MKPEAFDTTGATAAPPAENVIVMPGASPEVLRTARRLVGLPRKRLETLVEAVLVVLDVTEGDVDREDDLDDRCDAFEDMGDAFGDGGAGDPEDGEDGWDHEDGDPF